MFFVHASVFMFIYVYDSGLVCESLRVTDGLSLFMVVHGLF